MPKFELVSDQTNMVGERRVTYRCTQCGHQTTVLEFPFKHLEPYAILPCEDCAFISKKLNPPINHKPKQ